jgi:hypothetical protein
VGMDPSNAHATLLRAATGKREDGNQPMRHHRRGRSLNCLVYKCSMCRKRTTHETRRLANLSAPYTTRRECSYAQCYILIYPRPAGPLSSPSTSGRPQVASDPS